MKIKLNIIAKDTNLYLKKFLNKKNNSKLIKDMKYYLFTCTVTYYYYIYTIVDYYILLFIYCMYVCLHVQW